MLFPGLEMKSRNHLYDKSFIEDTGRRFELGTESRIQIFNSNFDNITDVVD